MRWSGKARNLREWRLKGMLTNEEFEVTFNTSNRNNNQQYVYFSIPLAQSMMALLMDEKEGW